MQDSQQNTFTSAQRLTQLAVLVDCDAPMEELQKTVGGADEEERAIWRKFWNVLNSWIATARPGPVRSISWVR